ncbi:MAG TPA: DUF4159 domain-containing protein [Gemmataceae bacterium]|nr:DUF4159 domain-containing protein [Gemmataceae bacterium]
MRSRIITLIVISWIFVQTPRTIAADRKEEPLVKRVEKAIERAKTFIKSKARDGNWESDMYGVVRKGGPTCLAVLALLTAGTPVDDPLIEKALAYIRSLPPDQTYTVGLQTMVLAHAGNLKGDKIQMEKNVRWMLDARVYDGGQLQGWSYHKNDPMSRNNSNTQYVLLGLHEALQAGVHIDQRDLEEIRSFYVRTQNVDGGWGYVPSRRDMSTATMTTAGLCGLLITGMDLNAGREKPLGNGAWKDCGVYKESEEVKKALAWLASHLRGPKDYDKVRFADQLVLYYFLYGLERAGRLSGLRFIGDHDWYREGCEYLVNAQDPKDGGWKGHGTFENSPLVNTCFSLLFLSKGRTPVLISKLSHAANVGGGRITFEDWNNDRNDVRNLVDFTSRELFKRMPLGWQIFDAKRAGGQSSEDLTAELLQSPIVYFNGHHAPQFNDKEIEMLQKYVEEGGFVIAEACCGSPDFDRGFRRLIEEKLFPDNKLQKLSPEHPIYRASGKFLVDPAKVELWGLNYGCKTVLVYLPNDVSCQWESNKFEDDAKTAFQIGANIIAYATGMEPPQPRLHEIDIVREEGKEPPKSYLKVAQLKHTGDWQPAKNAMPNLMREMAKRGAKVSIKAEQLAFNDVNLVDFKLLYMHGRNNFDLPNKKALDSLKFNLEMAGGLLFADACCGSKNFDKSFRGFIRAVFGKDLEPIPLRDELFGAELNGEAIEKVRCRRDLNDKADGAEKKAVAVGYPIVEPALEGIKVDGRWVVIYSKYDIGCALEKHASTECLGHDHESAVKLASAIVMYALKR